MCHSEEKNISKAAGVVGFFTFLSRILGLIRDMVLAGFFGAGMVTDALVVAFRIPNLLRRLFAEGSLTMAFIPVFMDYLKNRSKQEAFEMARAVLGILAFVLVVITLLGLMVTPWLVRVQAFGFGAGGQKFELTVLLTRITFPYIFCISIVAFFMGILNSMKHFAAPAAAPIFLNAGIIGAVYGLSPFFEEPAAAMATGVIIGGILQLLLQIPWVIKTGFRLLPTWRPAHPAVKRIGLLLLPALFGSAVYQLNSYIGTLLASFLAEGSVSWLYFADRLVQFPLGVFGIALSTAVLPSLSTQAATRDDYGFESTLIYALRLVFFITLPAMVGLIILGEPLIRVLFQRGPFDPHATSMTHQALFFYILGLWAFAGIRIVVAAFYAVQDTRTPVKVAVAALIINLTAALFLMAPLRHGGIALALSVSSSIQFCLLLLLLKKKLHLTVLKELCVPILKSLGASLCMGLVLYCLHFKWRITNLDAGITLSVFWLVLLVFCGMTVYFIMARILGCTELVGVKEMLWSIFNKLRPNKN